MLPVVTANGRKPTWVVCKDGTEYRERFERFLGDEFGFAPVGDAESLCDALRADAIDGIVLDMDFARTPAERLVDADGRTSTTLSAEARRRLSETQGEIRFYYTRGRAVKAA